MSLTSKNGVVGVSLLSREKLLTGIFAGVGALIVIFLVIPLAKLVAANTPQVLLETAREKEVMQSIGLTFRAALYATLIATLTGVPLAYLLARRHFPGKSVISAFVDLPMIIPHTAAGVALLFVFGKRFFAGRFFSSLGIHFVGDVPGIVIAMLFVSAPFLINQVREGFSLLDPNLEKAARILGASPWQVFWKVSLPLVKRHIASGMLMMWARGISEFGAVVVLAYHPMTAPVLVYERFESYGLAYARPVATVLILLTLVVFIGMRIIVWREKKNVPH